jgi:predicted N-acetyltransferase YhbS
MHDMLVRLYDLQSETASRQRVAGAGIVIRRPLPAERSVVQAWVTREFGSGWAGEVDAAVTRTPATCFIAVRDKRLVGCACWDVSALGFFGPAGVDPLHRGVGIGAALLFVALHAMRAQGYAYAIIGGVGPAGFYEKTVGARLIEGSNPGIFGGMLTSAPGEEP